MAPETVDRQDSGLIRGPKLPRRTRPGKGSRRRFSSATLERVERLSSEVQKQPNSCLYKEFLFCCMVKTWHGILPNPE